LASHARAGGNVVTAADAGVAVVHVGFTRCHLLGSDQAALNGRGARHSSARTLAVSRTDTRVAVILVARSNRVQQTVVHTPLSLDRPPHRRAEHEGAEGDAVAAAVAGVAVILEGFAYSVHLSVRSHACLYLLSLLLSIAANQTAKHDDTRLHLGFSVVNKSVSFPSIKAISMKDIAKQDYNS